MLVTNCYRVQLPQETRTLYNVLANTIIRCIYAVLANKIIICHEKRKETLFSLLVTVNLKPEIISQGDRELIVDMTTIET